MHPLDIYRVVDSLNVIDPALSSVDENFAPVPKMGTLRKWVVRLLHFISCGYYARNSQLDETTNRIYECALRTLPARFDEPAEKSKFINAFTKLQAINDNNEGSSHARIEQLITRIRNISLMVLNPRPAPIPGLHPPLQIPSPLHPQRSPLPVLEPRPTVLPVVAEPPPDPLLLQLTTEQLLKEIPRLRADDQRLPIIAERLDADNQLTGTLICNNRYAFSMLLSVCKDNMRFKVLVAEKLLDVESFHNLKDHFSNEVWEEVAKRWPLDKPVSAFRTPLGANLEWVVKFVNVLAAREDLPNSRKKENIQSLINHVVSDAINKPGFPLIGSISPHAMALCKVRDLIGIQHILKGDNINALHAILKPLIEQEECQTILWWLYFKDVPPEKCKQLPWKEYPRWAQFFLAHRAGQLEDVAYLRKICKEMTPEETKKAQGFLSSCEPYPFDLIKVLVDDSLSVQLPFVQLLILKGLEKPDNAITLPQPVWDSLEVQNVTNENARLRLFNALSTPVCRTVLRAWGDWSHKKDWPFIKFLHVSENPVSLVGLFLMFFDQNDSHGFRTSSRNKMPNGCTEVLQGFEQYPWKLAASLYQIHDFLKEQEWENRIAQYPKTYALVSKYSGFVPQAKEFRDKLIVCETISVSPSKSILTLSFSHVFQSNPKWEEVYAERNSEGVSNFVLAFLRNADPLSIALYLPQDDETMLFFAIFDEQARANLIKAMRLRFIRSREISTAFLKLLAVVQDVAKSPHLPPVATQQAAQFLSQLMGCLNIGGVCCPLSNQFNKPQFSDMTLKIGDETFLVHKAIVELDPLLQIALKENYQTLSKLCLKSLYGTLTPEEWQLPEAKAIMKEHNKLSLTKLANPSAGPGVVTLVTADGQTFRAHRFILAAALGYFEGIFSSGMNESKKDQIELQDVGGEEMQALLNYVYTDEQPEFEDKASENVFKAVLDRFNPTGSAP